MKKLILTSLIFILLFTGCHSSSQTPVQSSSKQYLNFTLRVIDGCEYLEYDINIINQRVYSLTHKGNCKNIIHICK